VNPKTRLIVAKPWVFIPARDLSPFHGATPGLYYRSDLCVAQAPCPDCGSKIGEPCKGKLRTYRVGSCRARKHAGQGDHLSRPVHLARVEVHFNDLDPWFGKSRGQHECVKICWPVRERTQEELEELHRAAVIREEAARIEHEKIMKEMDEQTKRYKKLMEQGD
jgi:hypothetical protein